VRALSKAQPESAPAGLPALPPRAVAPPPPPPQRPAQQWLKCSLGDDTRLLSYPLDGGLPALRAAVARKWPEETGPLVVRAMALPGAPPPPPEPPGGLASSEALSSALLPWLQAGRIAKLRLVRPGLDGEPPVDSGLLDEWILDFVSLVREHLGVDAEAHLDAHAAGMALCASAVSNSAGADAEQLFDAAAAKFQEAAALALYNWGNVAMCVARKRLNPSRPNATEGSGESPPPPPPPPPPPSAATVAEVEALLAAAEERFNKALRVKPDLSDVRVAFAEHRYERARLLAAIPGREAEADALFVESCALFETSFGQLPEETKTAAAEDVAPTEPEPSMRSQVLVMWGNVLYEHSQARVRNRRHDWEALLDAAVVKFSAAGCAQADVDAALALHASKTLQAS
jgi:hypothetical protein